MMLSDQALDALLKRLHLANTRRAWRDLTRRAEQEDWTYRDFLTLLVSEEIAHRQQTRLNRLLRRARFPFFKTIDDFNFTYQSTVRVSLLGSALASEFVTDGRCLILSGKPGRGKTHLAVAIGYRAIQNGFDARFVTAAELFDAWQQWPNRQLRSSLGKQNSFLSHCIFGIALAHLLPFLGVESVAGEETLHVGIEIAECLAGLALQHVQIGDLRAKSAVRGPPFGPGRLNDLAGNLADHAGDVQLILVFPDRVVDEFAVTVGADLQMLRHLAGHLAVENMTEDVQSRHSVMCCGKQRHRDIAGDDGDRQVSE